MNTRSGGALTMLQQEIATTSTSKQEEVEHENEDEEHENDDEEHETSNICAMCGIIYSGQSALSAHVESVHKGRRFLCTQCPDCFTAKSSFERHANLVHTGLETDYEVKYFLCDENSPLTAENVEDKIKQLEEISARKSTEIALFKQKIHQFKSPKRLRKQRHPKKLEANRNRKAAK
ncbi:uncharacterized protein LOC129571953 [Sitodiplosis mosellana]|uniref:uncharacterized protein LOC129571953 n=1 Tax=Sitodiplosis mosellana TaxID=263140 RepID=UPI0024446C1D|nr:uncharacterized protein LOC129571953 [Sitodiplosis mosellana]